MSDIKCGGDSTFCRCGHGTSTMNRDGEWLCGDCAEKDKHEKLQVEVESLRTRVAELEAEKAVMMDSKKELTEEEVIKRTVTLDP